jgi:hypothetical protein
VPQTFVIDQTATFAALAFLFAEPRMVFGEQGRSGDHEGRRSPLDG